MGKWAKYSSYRYDEKLEKDPQFKVWIQRTPDHLQNEGKSEAFCKLCRSCIRAKRSDLLDHMKTASHKRAMKALPSQQQPQLERFGFQGDSKKSDKVMDIKMSVCVASHASTRCVDHFGELSRDLGKGSSLENLRLHRTKCSKIIERVVAPSVLEEIVQDVGDNFYSIICDESTDISTKKQLALCIRYYSDTRKEMVTNFLGIVETPKATAELLYGAFTKFIKATGLKLEKLLALGTDGGLNLCGAHNSLYAYLKQRDIPHLLLVKCVCHSLDKCSSYASKELPEALEFLIRESRNWFSNSSVRKLEYSELCKELLGHEPPLLVKIALTRWLSFSGAVGSHVDQFLPLKTLFNKVAASKNPCPNVVTLAKLHNDPSSLLMLTFLKPVLRELAQLNILFQHTYADVTKTYRDLRTFVFALANRIVRPEALREAAQPGMLRVTELEALKSALSRQDALKPIDLVHYGESFRVMAMNLEQSGALSIQKLREAKSYCANFLYRLCKELTERLPACIAEIEKLRHIAPGQAIAKTRRPLFHMLPFELIPHKFDIDVLDGQWNLLGALTFQAICPEGSESLESIDVVKFWGLVHDLKNGAGERPFQQLAFVVLSLLALPLSNAVVERVFSIMNIVKTKQRNKLSTSMLNAILVLRLYLKSLKKCCVQFEPTEAMLNRFNSRVMYDYRPERRAAATRSQAEGGPYRPDQDQELHLVAEQAVDDVEVQAQADVEPGEPEVQGIAIAFEDDDEAILNVLDLIEDSDIDQLLR